MTLTWCQIFLDVFSRRVSPSILVCLNLLIRAWLNASSCIIISSFPVMLLESDNDPCRTTWLKLQCSECCGPTDLAAVTTKYKLKPCEGGWWKMTGFMALSLLSATNPNLNLALLMSSYTSLFLSYQDFSVWWGQIPPQRVHRGNANPSQEAEAQSNQEFQQLPGETVTCKFTPSHTHSCIFMLFKRDRVVVSWGAVLTTTF